MYMSCLSIWSYVEATVLDQVRAFLINATLSEVDSLVAKLRATLSEQERLAARSTLEMVARRLV